MERINANQDKNNQGESYKQSYNSWNGDKHPASNRSSDDRVKVCFECKQEGHMKWQCPTGGNNNSNFNGGQRQKPFQRGGRGQYGGGFGQNRNEKALVDKDPDEKYDFIENCPPPDDEDWGGGDAESEDEEERKRKKKEKKKAKKSEKESEDRVNDVSTASTPSVTSIKDTFVPATNSSSSQNSSKQVQERLKNHIISTHIVTEENGEDWGGSNDDEDPIAANSMPPRATSKSEYSPHQGTPTSSSSNYNSIKQNVYDPRSSRYQKDLPPRQASNGIMQQQQRNNSRERERSYPDRSNGKPSQHLSNEKSPNWNGSSHPPRKNNGYHDDWNSNQPAEEFKPKQLSTTFQPDKSWNLPFDNNSTSTSATAPAAAAAATAASSSWDEPPKRQTSQNNNYSWDEQPARQEPSTSLRNSRQNSNMNSKTPPRTSEAEDAWNSSWDEPNKKQQNSYNSNSTNTSSNNNNNNNNNNNYRSWNLPNQRQNPSTSSQSWSKSNNSVGHQQKQPTKDIVILDSDEEEQTPISLSKHSSAPIRRDDPPPQLKKQHTSDSHNQVQQPQIYNPLSKEPSYSNQEGTVNKLSLLINPDYASESEARHDNAGNGLAIENIFDFDEVGVFPEEDYSLNVAPMEEEYEAKRFESTVKVYEGVPPAAKMSVYYSQRLFFETDLLQCLYPHRSNKGSCFNVYNGPIRVRKTDSKKVSESQEIKVKAYTNHRWDDIKWIPSLKQTMNPKLVREFKSIDFLTAHNVFKQMRPREKYDRIFYLYWLEGATVEDDTKLQDYATYLFNNNVLAGINLENFCFTAAHIEQIFPTVQSFKRPGAVCPVKIVLLVNTEISFQVSHKQVPYTMI